ncbi:Helix-turn-helix domain protein [Novipirellula galeiformis]|uniref:Helix-turn-helix domain protein n=1 Tax=Novipirellula galeiformis TaxID=2528004 RepID=A0A5C6CGT5_9BACT|nr:helix-turn-helix domain-containing protein [Novipirellula galeiformis]TWU22491.1 Helix-turn-helix domain protein [Novipirellula galeiformis]
MAKNLTKAERIARATPIDQRLWLTRRMAADYLSVSNDTIIRFESTGDLKGIPIGSGREKRYKRVDLEELAERIEAQQTNIDRVKNGQA